MCAEHNDFENLKLCVTFQLLTHLCPGTVEISGAKVTACLCVTVAALWIVCVFVHASLTLSTAELGISVLNSE